MLRSRLMRRAFSAVAVAGIAVLSACSDSSGPGGSGNKYTLISIDGDALPVTYDYGAGDSETIKSGNITLLAGNKFTFRTSITEVFDGETATYTSGVNGTYEVDGDQYTFTATTYVFPGGTEPADPGDIAMGSLDGNDLTVDMEGSTMLFRK